ncbi:probable cationic amino acid transporter [Bicyclus anynana]|uniref:Probable cationic amino acid transporter n=1 Tax=Bicyclus anynana TaxID=110368 RepID=A0A6J1N2K4_BICAN|nr:probable cationic amino acid transporter [Bicyclus anynana]
MERFRSIDWAAVRRDTHVIFTKLIRTRDPRDIQGPDVTISTRTRLSRCLSTMDLISLGVGSCVGTGMYLVTGMVARNLAGPGAALSFIIAAIASIFSGACYAEFGVRVPNTTGSAYTYSYVTVGEFIAFVIGWNMILEYMIGTCACARALSACLDSLLDGAISNYVASKTGTIFGKPPDVVAFLITIMMTFVLVTGLKKSLFFNNLMNAMNLLAWVFMVGASFFYVDSDNWTNHKGFLPFGWSGVFNGAATCFYAFIGFDIIATTGEEATNPKRSIPLAIVLSLVIILIAYVSTSLILTLIVPYDEVDTNSPLLQMFSHVNAPACKYIVAMGALAGLSVSMFGSMFPLPRVVYAMALDGLLFAPFASVSETSGTPAFATVCGGVLAAFIALVVQLEVLVEMMSIGTLLAYTLVSTCVLILRYQPHSTTIVELLPQHLRTPVDPEGTASGQRDSTITGLGTAHVMPSSQRVMIRRVTRSSPDSDDTLPGDDSEDYGRDDTYLVSANTENEFYGAVPTGCSVSPSRCARFFDSIYRRLNALSYLCPGLFPWVDLGPATEASGVFVIKAVGIFYVLVFFFDVLAAYGTPSESSFTAGLMIILLLGIFITLLAISRKPQNRAHLIYATPCLPFVPGVAILANIYLILNLSIMTLLRFTVWMIFGLFLYFKYGIKNSTLEKNATAERAPTPPPPNPLNRTTIPPPSQPMNIGDRNIFEGDGNGLYGNSDLFKDTVLTWHETNLEPVQSSSSRSAGVMQMETRYDERTSSVSYHTYPRPPWADPDVTYDNWD